MRDNPKLQMPLELHCEYQDKELTKGDFVFDSDRMSLIMPNNCFTPMDAEIGYKVIQNSSLTLPMLMLRK